MKKIWASGYEKTMNCTLGFSIRLPEKCNELKLKLAASNTFRVFVNDKFIFHGPRRTAHNYSLISNIDLQPYLLETDNYLTVEVASYHINTFYTLDEDPFFCAEIYEGNSLIADSDNFACFLLDDRIQKVQRYSPQRPFVEVYSKYDKEKLYYGRSEYLPVNTVTVEGNKLLEAQTPKCDLRDNDFCKVIETGNVSFNETEGPLADRLFTADDPRRKGFNFSNCEVKLSSEALRMVYNSDEKVSDSTLRVNRYILFDYGRNITGFPELYLKVEETATVYFIFDELLWDELYEQKQYIGQIEPQKALPLIFCREKGCCNVIKWELTPGSYHLISFEPYTFQYGKVVVTKGTAQIIKSNIIIYENTEVENISYKNEDKELERIFKSAVNTLSQNSVDVLMDCPSRERAGWLCDSYFSSKAEKLMTGNNLAEKNLLRAYSLATSQPGVPEGMIPMCYPADSDNNYIPNWAMWYILELEDYYYRNNDSEMIEKSRDIVYGIFDFFKNFENEFGLLENLGGWVFVEHSKANEFVKHVNIPTNILYCATLISAGKVYSDEVLVKKGKMLKEKIIELSFDGKFFCDQLIRDNGALKKTENFTETCQYYAFYLNVADENTFPKLYHTMFDNLHLSKDGGTVEGLHPANAFIGKYLCMLYLMREGKIHNHLDEIKRYLKKMSDRTQTLWELDESTASCCHGFAAIAANLILAATTGFLWVDEHKKSIVFCEDFYCNSNLNVSIPFENGKIKIRCLEGERKIELPANTIYSINILK